MSVPIDTGSSTSMTASGWAATTTWPPRSASIRRINSGKNRRSKITGLPPWSPYRGPTIFPGSNAWTSFKIASAVSNGWSATPIKAAGVARGSAPMPIRIEVLMPRSGCGFVSMVTGRPARASARCRSPETTAITGASPASRKLRAAHAPALHRARARAASDDQTGWRGRRRGGFLKSAGGGRGLQLLVHATGKPLGHPLGHLLHDAGATELGDHAADRQVRIHHDAGPLFAGSELGGHQGRRAPASACLRTFGFDPNRVRGRIDVFDHDPSFVRQANRTQLDLDLSDVGLIVDHLGKRRTRHAVRDLLDVEQVRPRRIDRRTQLEPCGDDQRTYLSRKKWPAPRGSRPRAPVRASLRQEAVIGVPGSTRWIQVTPAGRCITLPSEPRIFSGSSALVRSQVAV